MYTYIYIVYHRVFQIQQDNNNGDAIDLQYIYNKNNNIMYRNEKKRKIISMYVYIKLRLNARW